MPKMVVTYWKKIFVEATKSMWEELGITGLLFGLILSGLYALVVGEQTVDLRGILVFTKVFIFLIVITWIFFVFKTAATQDKNQEEKISHLDEELNSITPHIHLIGDVKLDDVQMDMNIADDTGIFHVTGISHMAHVVFANNPKHITNTNSVIGVRAEITYLDSSKKVLFTTQGRWSNSDQPSEIPTRGKRIMIESTDFPNNGAHRTLDLLIKYPEDNHVYGYNNDSYDYPFYLHPQLEIKDSRFFIQVHLKGAYLPKKPYEFEVTTKGKGDIFTIKKTGKSEKWLRANSTQAQKILAKVKISEPKTKALKRKKKSSQRRTS